MLSAPGLRRMRSPGWSGPFAPTSGTGWPVVRLTVNADSVVKNGIVATSGTLNTATRVFGDSVWILLSAIVISCAYVGPVEGSGGTPAVAVGPSTSFAPYSIDMIVGFKDSAWST